MVQPTKDNPRPDKTNLGALNVLCHQRAYVKPLRSTARDLYAMEWAASLLVTDALRLSNVRPLVRLVLCIVSATIAIMNTTELVHA